jgi:hypothetical protein
MVFGDEREAYADLLCGHVGFMVYRLRQLRPEHYDYTIHQAAPSPRTLTVHTWQWLVCDRQHITEVDVAKHPRVPDAPENWNGLCDALAAENETWRRLILALTTEMLVVERPQFGFSEAHMNVRGYIGHMIQNAIYKHGQFSTIYFALGYDGEEPYSAPFPNPIYEEALAARTA